MSSVVNDDPCGICQESCEGYSAVACEKCDTWLHQKCEQLPDSDFNYLQKCALPYLCSKCCENEMGTFDYNQSLMRLGCAIQSGCLEMGVRMETIFMRGQRKRLPSGEGISFNHTMSVDHVASRLAGKTDNYVPVYVSGDGNGLFNALSMAIQGNEKLASEIRVRTCLEMYNHKSYYINKRKRESIAFVKPSYEEALKECGQNFCCLSSWTMHAAATVVSRCIRSLYPPVNGILDTSFPVLNCHFEPRALRSKHKIHILWSSKSKQSEGIWVPNHFVPMLPLSLEKPSPSLPEAIGTPSSLAHPVVKSPLVHSPSSTEHLLPLKNTTNSLPLLEKTDQSKQKDLSVNALCSDISCGPPGKRLPVEKRQDGNSKRRCTESAPICHIVAENIQIIDNLVASRNSLVKSIIQEQEKAPSLVLYTDDQITDIKTLCCNGQTVLGVGKPFELCGILVTATYYKQIRVTRNRSNNHPVFLGPLFIHHDTNFESYSKFLNHIRTRLSDTDKSKLMIGSNGDWNLVKAILGCFPGLKHIKVSKSFNHIMKQAADGKGLLHLVENLDIIIKVQYIDLRRSLFGMGEFRLADSHEHLRSSYTLWVSITDDQRNRLYQRFQNYIPEH